MYDVCARPWLYYVKPVKIIGNLYYIGNKDVSVHLIASSDGLILIDTAFPQTAYQILENIRLLGFNTADIRTIIHTHAHYDHLGGTKAIVELTGAKTYLGEADLHFLEDEHDETWSGHYYGVEFHERFGVDVLLKDGDTIECGDVSIKCVSTPGHTPGTMSLLFDICENGRIYKVGLHGGTGLNTLSKAYLHKSGLPLTNRDLYLSSIEKLRPFPVDVVLGSHPDRNDTLGKISKMSAGYNPFWDSAEWLIFLDNLESGAKYAFSHD